MLLAERRRSREQEAFEAWRFSSRALDVSTDIVERLRPHFGYIDRSFDYVLKADGLYQQEAHFGLFLKKGRQRSERLRHGDPHWAIEYERNLAEECEGKQVEALARGEYPEGMVLVTVSAVPESVHQGRDVLTYRASDPVALVRFWEKTATGVRGRTVSCEGSSPVALKMAVQAVAGPQMAEFFAGLSAAEAIANPLPVLAGGRDVHQEFVRTYDAALFALTGQETKYGVPIERLKTAGELNTLIEIPAYQDKVHEAYRRVFELDHRRLDTTQRQAEYEKIMQEIPAAIWLRVKQPQLARTGVSNSAATQAARASGVSFKAGCPTAPNGSQALSAQFGKEAEVQKYRYTVKGECRACLEETMLPPEDEGCGVCEDCTEFHNKGGDLMKVLETALKQKATAKTTQEAKDKAIQQEAESKTMTRMGLRIRHIMEVGGARVEIYDESTGQWRRAMAEEFTMAA